MWTAGFPEPKTFSKRVGPAAAGPASATSTSSTTTRCSATGCSTSSGWGCRWSPRIHHPITFDRRIDLADGADAGARS